MSCKRHPDYKGKKQPLTLCRTCWTIWYAHGKEDYTPYPNEDPGDLIVDDTPYEPEEPSGPLNPRKAGKWRDS